MPASVNVNYEQQKIRCGKARCRCNTSDQASWHGPYWYAYWNDPKTGKKRSRYVGKNFDPPTRERPDVASEQRAAPAAEEWSAERDTRAERARRQGEQQARRDRE